MRSTTRRGVHSASAGESPVTGFTEGEVTQGEEVPDEVRQLAIRIPAGAPATEAGAPATEEDFDALVAALQITVDAGDVLEIGHGDEFVYAYGYRCAPDRLKIGSCSGDVIARIAAQIGTGTPDKRVLLLRIRTQDCRALERTLHGMVRLKGRQIAGAGAEWFLATRDDVAAAYERVV